MEDTAARYPEKALKDFKKRIHENIGFIEEKTFSLK